MTIRRWWLAVAGGCALVVLGACGSSVAGRILTNVGDILLDAGNANAQVPSACKKWQVQRMSYDNIETKENTTPTTSDFAGTELTIPDGWEPFGGTAYGGSSTGLASQYLLLRKCVL